ncbi:MAG: acyltransferase, partial [Ginsengibacter sp.]
MKHIKQLDSLRAIAVILVLFWHWLPATSFVNRIDNGALGVDIFFVLSGFLITGILLENKAASDNGSTRALTFKNFYARRFLRIFPIYYLTIILIFFIHTGLGASFSTGELVSSVTYTSNFYFFERQQWGDLTVHFWSLAVEEQFYLIWPFVILFVRKKYLLPVILVFILIGCVSQSLMTSAEFGHIPTYTCFDAFGFGAALAWIVRYRIGWLKQLYVVLCIFSAICAGMLIIQSYYGTIPYLPNRTLHSIIAVWIITFILLHQDKKSFAFSFILNSRIMHFIGKISYGIYLYHVPIQWFQFKWSNHFTNLMRSPFLHRHESYLIFCINFLLVLLISWISFQIIELPILRLKKKFSY